MFCGVCGTKNPDGSAFCKNCGSQLNTPKKPPDNVRTPVPVSKRKRQQNNKKVGMIAVSIVVIVALVLLFALFGGRSYKSTVKKFVNASLEPNAAAIMELIPEDLVDYILEEEGYDEDEFDELVKELDEELQDQFDYIERYLGEDWKMSYEILTAESLKGDDLEDLKDDYEDLGVKISAAKRVEVELTVIAGETETSNSTNLYVIKVGRNWCLDIGSMGSLF